MAVASASTICRIVCGSAGARLDLGQAFCRVPDRAVSTHRRVHCADFFETVLGVDSLQKRRQIVPPRAV